MSLPDGTEYWGGKSIPEKKALTQEQLIAKKQKQLNNDIIKKNLKEQYPLLSKGQIRKIAISLGGYSSIENRHNLYELAKQMNIKQLHSKN